ncbi:DNA cytosine methyltransferase [Acidovorax sp. SUPP1855]|uniref:DNA cytosine methyltransferase n=1 Tax=Acidovorax sp. SUPP1855 TaxID=431774 RepID=UPI0023DE569C|nr:DNA cytosine methyltransferase [Acidovorax sp. SUPP1855]GKS83646.1 DNA cytosine methyltransferase [Acidovorax sp. SUPP1855]
MTHPPIEYGSVCSGIEAASLAWQPLGWHPAWFSEIDPFPMAVLTHRHPGVPNLGDMARIAARVVAGTVAAPDILVGGTPCQAFSIAGSRQGLADPRGALTLKYTELANAIDQARQAQRRQPAVIVWENVPGVLSDRSNAFGCLLGALAGESCPLQPAGGRWTHAGCVSGPRRRIAWRVLDAQYFGVAQRRKRVFLVASGRTGFDPAAVLFESGGLPGHPSPGRPARQESATAAAMGAEGAGRFDHELNSAYGKVSMTVCFGGGHLRGPIDKAACLTARGHKCDFEVETFAAQSVAGSISHTLDTANRGKGCGEDGTGKGVPIVVACAPQALAFAQNSRSEVRLESGHGQIAGTLSTGGGAPGQGRPVIASITIPAGHTAGAIADLGSDLFPTLRSSRGGGDLGHVVMPNIEAYFQCTLEPPEGGWLDWSSWRVRRLMPIECERLQGLPDDYTLVPYRGKPAADAPRYKAIGNSMAVPCMAWLGQRLHEALPI